MNWNNYYIRVNRSSEGEYLDSGTFYKSVDIYDGDIALSGEDGRIRLSGYSPEGKLYVTQRSESKISFKWEEPRKTVEFSFTDTDPLAAPSDGMDCSYGGSYRYFNLTFTLIARAGYKPERGSIEYYTKQEWEARSS